MTRRGFGSRNAVATWSVSGETARNAAAALSKTCLIKKQELQIAADWPRCKEQRASLEITLKRLKQAPKEVCATQLSWPYLAGFFDAEGHIQVPATGPVLRLSLSQWFGAVLFAIQTFLSEEGFGTSVQIYHPRRRAYVLTVTSTKVSKSVLQELIKGSLTVKRGSAESALAVNAGNANSIRQSLSKLGGWQGRYARLDAEGCGRAQEIKKLSTLIRFHASKSNVTKIIQLKEQLQELKAAHALKKAEATLQRLRSDIRVLVRSKFETDA
eukprot:TRINITY_DN18530_c0_g1_i1.p1 TRINITY_DN18530_c0_g1~~TRINITY_DN18530_c0_g1_i1.p1  ORF type:complete len:308 (-),score=44.66 TRINITY_DN18530_c0_g1_i1:362-1171(-)